MRARNLIGVLLLAIFCASAAASAAYGQSGINSSGTGGINTIKGRLYLPSGKMFDTTVSVELQSTNSPSLSVYTDRNGSFSFQNIGAGNYSIVVNAGDAFETAREYITIDNEIQGAVRITPIPKTFTVPIYLQEKRAVGQKTGVINAKWSNVPDSSMDHYRKGLRLLQDKKTEEATAEFKKSVELYPAFALPHTELGKLDLVSGHIDEAVRAFRDAVRCDASDFEANLNLGIALLNKLDYSEAETVLKTAGELNKTAATPRYYLGVVFVQVKNLDAAQKEMEAAKQLMGDKAFPLLHRYLGGIYALKHLDKLAVVELEAYLQSEPKARDADRIRQTIADMRSKQN